MPVRGGSTVEAPYLIGKVRLVLIVVIPGIRDGIRQPLLEVIDVLLDAIGFCDEGSGFRRHRFDLCTDVAASGNIVLIFADFRLDRLSSLLGERSRAGVKVRAERRDLFRELVRRLRIARNRMLKLGECAGEGVFCRVEVVRILPSECVPGLLMRRLGTARGGIHLSDGILDGLQVLRIELVASLQLPDFLRLIRTAEHLFQLLHDLLLLKVTAREADQGVQKSIFHILQYLLFEADPFGDVHMLQEGDTVLPDAARKEVPGTEVGLHEVVELLREILVRPVLQSEDPVVFPERTMEL